ncbi:MAG TPA: CvpA family protein [Candidatus Binataceae bacterium]
MNGLDVAIVIIGGLGVLSGLRRGVLRMATSIIALAGAIYFASIYYPQARDLTLKYVPMTPTSAAVAGYVLVFLIVFVVVQTAGGVLTRLVRTASLGWVDRLAGGAAGGAIAIAIMGMALMLLTAALPTNSDLLKQSQLAPPVLRYTDLLMAYIPAEVKVLYEHKRKELMRYWLRQELEGEASPTATSTR